MDEVGGSIRDFKGHVLNGLSKIVDLIVEKEHLFSFNDTTALDNRCETDC